MLIWTPISKLTSAGIVKVDKAIKGIVDTAAEAKLMADTLKSHRSKLGFYTEMKMNDPAREIILKSMTMESSLGLAQLGFGVTTLALGAGIFMIITGIAIGGTGLALRRIK